MVYSTRRFVVCRSVCHFVIVFFSPFNIAITSLGEERANLSASRTFVRFVLVWICRFSLPLGVWKEQRFVIVAIPGLFSYLFWYKIFCNLKWCCFYILRTAEGLKKCSQNGGRVGHSPLESNISNWSKVVYLETKVDMLFFTMKHCQNFTLAKRHCKGSRWENVCAWRFFFFFFFFFLQYNPPFFPNFSLSFHHFLLPFLAHFVC